METIGTLVQLSVQELPTIENFLLSIGREEVVKIFEKEMIDFETLPEITHEDLVSIGVNAFGQRHKIIKEVKKQNKNIVDTLLSCTATRRLSCKGCNNITAMEETLQLEDSLQHVACTLDVTHASPASKVLQN